MVKRTLCGSGIHEILNLYKQKKQCVHIDMNWRIKLLCVGGEAGGAMKDTNATPRSVSPKNEIEIAQLEVYCTRPPPSR